MSLIDSTYFHTEISIPDKGDFENISDYITKYEREFLINAFGYTLYKLIAAYDVDNSPQRIKDIVEGKEFTVDDLTFKWNGLTNSEKISPIAYYVYYWYTKFETTSLTTTGEVDDEHENASNSISTLRMKAWNNMVKLVGNYYYYNYYSLYYFMHVNISDYSDWIFDNDKFKKINSFDI